MHPYVSGIRKLLEKNRNSENAVPMKQYMRNQFDFFGIKMDIRRQLCKTYLQSIPFPEKDFRKIVMELWAQPERELQYFAIEIMIRAKKHWTSKDIVLFEKLVISKSWWDTVDYLTTSVIGPWFLNFPQHIIPVTQRWNQSKNIWLQRASVLFQLKYKDKTDIGLLTRYIRNLSGSTEFFVQKAIGWVLREYSKKNTPFVETFVKENKLQPLSIREAMKLIKRSK